MKIIPGVHPASKSAFSTGCSGREVRQVTHLHPMQRLRMSGAILPLSYTLYFRIKSSGTCRRVVGFPAFRRTWCLHLQETRGPQNNASWLLRTKVLWSSWLSGTTHTTRRHILEDMSRPEMQLWEAQLSAIYFTLHYFTVFMDIVLLPSFCRGQVDTTFQRIMSRPT